MVRAIIILFTISFLFSCLTEFEDYKNTNPLDENNPETRGKPFTINAYTKDNSIYLSWNKIDVSLLGYLLYRATIEDRSESATILHLLETIKSSENGYVDSDIQDGTTYFYYVVAWKDSNIADSVAVENSLLTEIIAEVDSDLDSVRDIEDDDADNDGLLNIDDNCETLENNDQLDVDEDDIGDFCDNCPIDSNSDQMDTDADTFGDACDFSPETLITLNPNEKTNQKDVTFEFRCNRQECTFECKVDLESYKSCTSPYSYTNSKEIEHTFYVRAIDEAGNTEETPESASWTYDITAPATTLKSSPDAYSNDSENIFTFSASEEATFECAVDLEEYVDCKSPVSYPKLSEGEHTLFIKSTDLIGNKEQTPISFTWVYDAISTIIDSQPSAFANTSTFTFSSSEDGTFECAIDSDNFKPCESPKSFNNLTQGSHTFYVRAIDVNGVIDNTIDSYTWNYDTIAPDTKIVTKPTNPGNTSIFSFSSNESATFKCKVDNDNYSVCTSPKTIDGLLQGNHTFYVRAIDTAGNIDGSAESYSWVYDTVAPTTTINSYPQNPSNSANAVFTFTANENASFQCKLDNGFYESCSSPIEYVNFSQGNHIFYIVSKDLANNSETNIKSFSWVYDKTSPDSIITSNPTNPTSSSMATFTFVANESSIFRCKLDNNEYKNCSSPITYDNVSLDEHKFYLLAIDVAGNTEPTPTEYRWKRINYNYAGTHQFGSTYSDYEFGSSIAVDISNNLYVTGSFGSTIDFDSSSEIDNHTSNGDVDIFINKLTNSNVYDWTHTFGSSSWDNGNAIITDSAGNIYTTGQFSSSVDFDFTNKLDVHNSNGDRDGFISKIKSDGSYGWTKTFGAGDFDYGSAITVDSVSNIYVLGWFSYTVDFDFTNGTDYRKSYGGSRDVSILKIKSDGSNVWTKTFGGGGFDYGSEIIVDRSNNIYLTGYFTDIVDFDYSNTSDYHNSNGSEDIFLMKLNTDGAYSWTKTFGGSSYDRGESISVDSSDNVYLIGYFQNTVDFDFTEESDNHSSSGYSDIFVTKINSDGSYGWTQTFGGSGDDRAYSIKIDGFDNIFISGSYSKTVDFDFTDGIDNHTSNGNTDIFLMKINTDSSYDWTITIGGNSEDATYSMVLDNFDNIFMTGVYSNTVDFDFTEIGDSKTSIWGKDIFITKIESNQE